MGRYSLGPSPWYCIDIACKHVTRTWECLIMEWVKRLVGNEIELGMVDTKWSDLGQVIISRDKRNWLCSLLVHTITTSSSSKWESSWISRSLWWLLIGEESRSCPRYSRTVWWHTLGSSSFLSGYDTPIELQDIIRVVSEKRQNCFGISK
jgi:hypothetical protein